MKNTTEEKIETSKKKIETIKKENENLYQQYHQQSLSIIITLNSVLVAVGLLIMENSKIAGILLVVFSLAALICCLVHTHYKKKTYLAVKSFSDKLEIEEFEKVISGVRMAEAFYFASIAFTLWAIIQGVLSLAFM